MAARKFEALTRIGLPVHEEREVYTDVTAMVPTGETTYFEEGDSLTDADFLKHYKGDARKEHLVEQATAAAEESISQFLKHKSMKEVS